METLASTKDVLGEHLHQKVKEEIHNAFAGDASHDTDTINTIIIKLVSKLTGILLERPLEDIFNMLMDKDLLQRNIKVATDSVRDIRASIGVHDSGGDCSVTDVEENAVSTDDIREQLFQKVCQLDPDLAPQITGILLDMEKEDVNEMLKIESVFVEAFEKARSCVRLHEMEILDQDEDISVKIYQRAETLYRHHAPKITGMILELDPTRLKQMIGDKHSLDKAITKAYSVLSSNDGVS